MMDLKFKDVIKQNMLFVENPEMTQKYLTLFQELEEVEPHAVYPTSIYRQSDGCTVAIEVEDFDAAIAALRQADVKITMEPLDTGVCQMAGIADPDGNPLLIHKRKPQPAQA